MKYFGWTESSIICILEKDLWGKGGQCPVYYISAVCDLNSWKGKSMKIEGEVFCVHLDYDEFLFFFFCGNWNFLDTLGFKVIKTVLSN